MSDILWRGVWGSSAGVVVEHRPTRVIPERVYETVNVPGRDGAVIFDQGRYADVDVTYQVYMRGDGTQHRVTQLARWLGKPGTGILRDTFDPTYFRRGYVSDPAKVTDAYGRFFRTSVTWTCQPQRWLVIGNVAQSVENGATISNPTAFPARPLVRVTGSGTGKLALGTYQVELADIPATGLTIDSEQREVYGASLTNLNSHATMPDGFPLLEGDSVVGWSGGITSVEVTPRWWTL